MAEDVRQAQAFVEPPRPVPGETGRRSTSASTRRSRSSSISTAARCRRSRRHRGGQAGSDKVENAYLEFRTPWSSKRSAWELKLGVDVGSLRPGTSPFRQHRVTTSLSTESLTPGPSGCLSTAPRRRRDQPISRSPWTSSNAAGSALIVDDFNASRRSHALIGIEHRAVAQLPADGRVVAGDRAHVLDRRVGAVGHDRPDCISFCQMARLPARFAERARRIGVGCSARPASTRSRQAFRSGECRRRRCAACSTRHRRLRPSRPLNASSKMFSVSRLARSPIAWTHN